VLVSSTAVYGQDGGEIVDEHSATRPTRYAGRRMLESEAVAAAAGIPLTIVRAAGIYGPGRTRLLDRVRRGDIELGERESYTNRIHRDDLAGFIAHLLKLAQPEPIYIAADDDPAERGEVVNWLAARLGVTPPPRGGSAVAGANKRCSNAGLHRSGFELRHPSYRDGYVAVIGRYLSGE
jgi:nucleoside-diphosphate-sugar epimerase